MAGGPRHGDGGEEPERSRSEPVPPTPWSSALGAAAKVARELGSTAGDEAARLARTAADASAARVATGLKPVRQLGRSIEGRRIAAENAAHDAASATVGRAKRAVIRASLHGSNVVGAAGATAFALIADPLLLLHTRAKYLQVRREIADALVRYDEAVADATRAEREHTAAEAVERLKRWDHRTTVHHRSPYLHVSVGQGRAEAWGMLLRGPHAGCSLASVAPDILAELRAHVPDEQTADALEAWQGALLGAACPASDDDGSRAGR